MKFRLRYALSNTYLDKVVVGLDNHEQLRKLITIANKGYLKLNVKFKSNNEINLMKSIQMAKLKIKKKLSQ